MLKTIEFAGGKCFYKTEGKGKAVMLVHGFMEEGSMWDGVMNALKRKHKLIVPDLPGFGKSEFRNSKSATSMDWYADFLKTICEQEKTKSFILLGHSMGGYVALSFAEKYPNLLRGLGLINSHCFEDSADKKANRKKAIAFIVKHGTKHFVNELYHKIFKESYQKTHPKLLKSMITKAEEYPRESVIAASEAMMNRKDKSDVLKKAKVPVLLVSGREDETVPLELSLEQAALAAVTDFHLLGNSKHMTIFEQKRKSITAIQNFLEFCNWNGA